MWKLNKIQPDTTIAHLKSIFEEHGIPNKLVTGNDAQFTSALFQEFCSTYGFTHVRTSPYYPQASGFNERTIQTVKNLFQKFRESGADPHLAMLCLRSSPLDQNIASPAEFLNSRVYQANLSSVSKPGLSLSADGDVNTKLQARQDQHKSQYNRSSKPLPAIHPDGPVCVCSPQNHKWEPGIVKCSTQAPHSYMITMANGSTLRWNCSHYLRPTGEKICIQSNIPSDEPSTPLNKVYSTMPSTLPINERLFPACEQTTLAPDSTPQLRGPAPEAPPRRSSRLVKPPDRLDL